MSTIYVKHEGLLEKLPEKIREFIPRWSQLAKASDASWWEKDACLCWTYEGTRYLLFPNALGLNHYTFADAMFASIEAAMTEDLQKVGCTNIVYEGMMD